MATKCLTASGQERASWRTDMLRAPANHANITREAPFSAGRRCEALAGVRGRLAAPKRRCRWRRCALASVWPHVAESRPARPVAVGAVESGAAGFHCAAIQNTLGAISLIQSAARRILRKIVARRFAFMQSCYSRPRPSPDASDSAAFVALLCFCPDRLSLLTFSRGRRARVLALAVGSSWYPGARSSVLHANLNQ